MFVETIKGDVAILLYVSLETRVSLNNPFPSKLFHVAFSVSTPSESNTFTRLEVLLYN